MQKRSQSGTARALWVTYREFAANTGLHGLKYITEDGRRPVERVLWLLVVASGVTGAAVMASTFWRRFSAAPTRASVDTNHFPAWRLPFPATTLCNVNRVFRSKAEALMDRVEAKGKEREEAMSALRLLLEIIQPRPDQSSFQNKTASTLQSLLDRKKISIREVMADLDQGCDQMLERCMWQGELTDCKELFEERKSYLGFCCSFNYRGVIEVTKEDKKVLEMGRGEPRHSRFYSHRMGLSVILNPQLDDYFLSTLYSAGIRMIIHRVDDFPDEAAEEKILPAGREMLVGVTPFSTFCTDAVRSLQPHVRECVFPDEKPLRYFPVYSATNCLTECRMNHSLIFCGCSPFYYHEVGGIRICGLSDVPCLNKFYFALRTRRAFLVSERGDDDPEVVNNSIACDCPPLCNQVGYDVQVSSGDFAAARFQRSLLLQGANVTSRTLLHFYLNNHVTVRTKRDVVSSWNDLLSSLGGVFSLFLGCSFMSVIEVVYFFTLRLGLRYRRLAGADDAADAQDAYEDGWRGGDGRFGGARPRGHAPAPAPATWGLTPNANLSLWKTAR